MTLIGHILRIAQKTNKKTTQVVDLNPSDELNELTESVRVPTALGSIGFLYKDLSQHIQIIIAVM